MSAPIDDYRTICLKDKKNSTNTEEAKEQRVLAAKPLENFVAPATSTSPIDTQMSNFKKKFFLDDVLVLTTKDGSNLINGVIGLVDLTKTNNEYGFNAKHHNISETTNTTTHPSRLSRLRTKKNGKDYALLNDAGLNTTPDIYGEVILCYNNAVRAKVYVKSAYYLNTKNAYTINVMDGSKAISIENDFTTLSNVSAKEEKEFISPLIFLMHDTIGSNYVTLDAKTQNDEGVYESIGTKKTTKIPKTLALPVKVFQFNSIPSDYAHLVSDGNVVTRYMTIEDSNELADVFLGRKDGGDVNRPTLHPIAYKDDFLSRKFEGGTWMTDRQADMNGNIRFYHFYTETQSQEWKNTVNCYWDEPYNIPSKAISFTVQVLQFMEGLSPVEGYDYKAVISASFVNTYDPTDVNLRGTMNLYSSQSESATSNTGVQWADKIGTPRSINITLHADGRVTGVTEFYFKKTTTSARYLKMTGAYTQDNYPMEYGNYALIPN